MKKKIVCAMMCVAMVATSLVGCGSKADDTATDNAGTETTDDAAAGDDAAASDDAAANAGSGKVYYLNFKPEQADQWVELAKEYTDETGVEVDVQTAASGTYESQLKSEMAKDEAPTLFQVNGPGGLATWKDYCYDL